jgi:ATP-dependent DNA helicase RecG
VIERAGDFILGVDNHGQIVGIGDFDITDNTNLVAEMFIRKQRTYTVNEVFHFAEMGDLRSDLIQLVRIRVTNIHEETHPWMNLTDMELLRSAGLFLKDYLRGKEGITMAGILLFGKDETILSVLPHHRTDAIVRRINLDRHDDQDDIRTNLLESYSRLLAFCAKHLNDPSYLDGDTRISLRDKIVRELAANMLIHREYVMANPARLVMESDRLYTENSNRPHGFGQIDINHFTSIPKNPVLAKMFNEIGYADELGSGIRNTTRYTALYSGKIPIFEEGDVFRVIIPLKPENLPQGLNTTLKLKYKDDEVGERIKKPNGNTQHDVDHDGQHAGQHDGFELNKMQTMLLAFCETPKTSNDTE